MKSIQQCVIDFETVIKGSLELVSQSNLLTDELVREGKKEAEKLLENINQNFTIKVPFVGDFSAGKSSLLNALIGREVLPTSIRPETAVSYELYYAPVEVAELYRKGSEISNCKLDGIKDLDVEPGDIVKVYVDNLKIKELFNKGITLVDMPGSDSGIEAHQKAIMSYLQEGSAFITLVDIEQGSIKGSNLKFMQEILGYNLDSAVLITKSDKKPASEQAKIKEFVLEQVQRYDKNNSSVGLVSAADGDIADLEKVLSNLDGASLFTSRYQPAVESYLNQWQEWLQLEQIVTSETKDQLAEKLESLRESANQAKEEILSQKQNPELGMFAVDEILNKVTDALKGKANTIATYLVNNDQDSANREISETVRPVLINSLQGIQVKMMDQISMSFEDVNNKISGFIGSSDKAFSLLGSVRTQVNNFTNKVSGTNLGKYRAVTALVGVTTSFVAPWLEVIIIFAPEILSLIYGRKDAKDKLTQTANAFISTSIPQIVEKLKPEVEKGIEEQRQIILEDIEKSVEQKVKEVDQRIEEQQQQIVLSEVDKNKRLEAIAVLKNKIQEFSLIHETALV